LVQTLLRLNSKSFTTGYGEKEFDCKSEEKAEVLHPTHPPVLAVRPHPRLYERF